MPAPKFKVGEQVLGLWPGSRLYFKARVIEVDKDYGTYDLQFEEGTVYTLLEKHVKPVDSFKKLESKSNSAPTTPKRKGRSSSVSRSRSRSRSRSQSRTPASKVKVATLASKDQKSKSVTSKTQAERKVKEINSEPSTRRRSARLVNKAVDLPDSSNKNHIQANDGHVGDKEEKKIQPKEESPEKPEVGDSVNTTGAVFIILFVPIIIGIFHWICLHNKCQFQGLAWNQSQEMRLLDPFAAVLAASFCVIIALLTGLPIGDISDSSRIGYHQNALACSLILMLSIWSLMHFVQYPAHWIIQLYSQFLIPALVGGILLGVVAFWKTRDKPTRFGPIADFIIGREVNVKIGGLNAKVLLYRICLFTLIILNYLFIESDFERNKAYSITLIFSAILQILYGLDGIWAEHLLPYLWDYNYVKFGALVTISHFLHPLFVTLVTYYIANYRVELPYYCLAPIGVLFLSGYLIKMKSRRQNASLQIDPDNKQWQDMETLSTPSGQKLLISGLWGKVRHPIYLGDILMHWAFVLPCGLNLSVPYAVVIIITVGLLVQSSKVDAQRKIEYGPAWDRYCQRVPSRVIPGIY